MNLFDKIKNLLKKRNQTNNTTLTQVKESFRKYSELDRREKKKVSDGVKNLISENYKSILYYTKIQDNEASNLCNLYLHLKMKYGNQYDKVASDNSANDIANMIDCLLLSSSEFVIIKNDFERIKNKYEIKFHTLNRIIENFDRHNLIKNRKEKLDYLNNKALLLEKRESIRNNITWINLLLVEINNRITECNELTKKYYLLNRCNSQLNTGDKSILEISKALENNILSRISHSWYSLVANDVKNQILDKVPFNSKFDDWLLKRIKETIPVDYKSIDYQNPEIRRICFTKYFMTLKIPLAAAWQYLIRELDNKLLLELYSIIAKYVHQDEIYKYEHRNDYKIYLKEMNAIINEYENTPSSNWSTNLSDARLHYQLEINVYSKNCIDYLNDDIKNELLYTYLKLCWLNGIDYNHFSWYVNKRLFIGNNGEIIEIPDSVIEDHFFSFADELLTKVENKYGIKLSDLNYLTKDKNYRINFIESYMTYCFRYFYNILNDNDNFDISFYVEDVYPMIYKLNNNQLNPHKEKINKHMSLDDLFFCMKAIGKDCSTINFNHNISFTATINHKIINGDFANFLALIKQQQLNAQYDERILVVPKIRISGYTDDMSLVKYVKDGWKNYKEFNGKRTISTLAHAIVVDDMNTITTILSECYKCNRYPTIHLFIPDQPPKTNDLRHSIINYYYCLSEVDRRRENFIIHHISEDTTYSDISDILNQEIEKENSSIIKELGERA